MHICSSVHILKKSFPNKFKHLLYCSFSKSLKDTVLSKIFLIFASASLILSVFLITDSISSFFCMPSFFALLLKSIIEVSRLAPAILQPMGPAMASNACPAAIPPPPTANVPPPSHARAAVAHKRICNIVLIHSLL